VTVLEANGDFDASRVWATCSFRVREVSKSGLYRHEIRRGAIDALVQAIGRIADGDGASNGPVPDRAAVQGRARPLMTQDVRAIDWHSDRTASVMRKIRAAEGHPGVLDAI
jgi:putative two-component system protein, hydrogenase maturation factor HypX/HoxX